MRLANLYDESTKAGYVVALEYCDAVKNCVVDLDQYRLLTVGERALPDDLYFGAVTHSFNHVLSSYTVHSSVSICLRTL